MSSPPSAVTAHPAPRHLPLGAGGAVARVPATRGRVAPCVPSPIRCRGLCRPAPGCRHVPAAAAPLPHAHHQVYESIPKSWEVAAAPAVTLRTGRSCVPSGWGFHAWPTAGEHLLGVHGGLGLSQTLCSPAFWGRLSFRSREGAATSVREALCAYRCHTILCVLPPRLPWASQAAPSRAHGLGTLLEAGPAWGHVPHAGG